MRKVAEKNSTKSLRDKIAPLDLSATDATILEELMTEPITYIFDERLRRSAVMKPIMQHDIRAASGTTLAAEQEQTLFLQFNYARHQICRLRRKLLRLTKWPFERVTELLRWNQKQLAARSTIISANLGLVPAMAKRSGYIGVEFNDLISEGSFALLRATEKFDCSRGFRFSTYACRAIFKAFSRIAKQTYRYRNFFPAQFDVSIEKDNKIYEQRDSLRNEWIGEVRNIMSRNLADLSQIEQSVVRMRFSLNNYDYQPLTLKQVGDKLGLTKERIRQIQKQALRKLRVVTEERMAAVYSEPHPCRN